MAYIYKITNRINKKGYIGKTYTSVEQRWKERLQDYNKIRCEKRPLYSAMNKYGIENFSIEQIEETSFPEEREKYWIEKYGSFHNGYNATLGGDGKPYIDYDLVVATYNILQNQKHVAEKLNINEKTVHKILKEKEVNIIKNVPNSKKIAQYDLNGNFIESFISAGEAGRKIISVGLSKAKNSNSVGNRIRDCANGQSKTAYGFVWKFI